MLLENNSLKEEIRYLNFKLGVLEHRAISDGASESFTEDSLFQSPVAVLEVSNLYNERLKAVADTKNCECWGIHDSLEGSYSVLKWLENAPRLRFVVKMRRKALLSSIYADYRAFYLK